MRRSTGGRRPGGQALIEFVLVFPLFFFVFCAIFEMGFVMNAWVTLKDIALDASAFGSRPDPTLSRSPREVLLRMKEQFAAAPWLGIVRDSTLDASANRVTVNVNAPGPNATFDTRVQIEMQLRPVIAGGAGFNVGGMVRRIPLFKVDTVAQIENYTNALDGTPVQRTYLDPISFLTVPHPSVTMNYQALMAL